MAFTITSSTQSADEMAAAIEHFGGRVSPPEPGTQPAADAKADAASGSEPTPASGESPSGQDGKPASESDTEETKTQAGDGKAVQPTETQTDTNQPGKNFEPRRKQLERQLSRLHEDLEIERGGKAVLQKQIEDLNTKLAALQPPADAAPPQDAGPVKPKRPTLAECDFDAEKHEAALELYDSQMLDFSRAIARKEFEQSQKAEREAEAKRKQDEAAAQAFNQFSERKDQQRSEYQDWDEVFEQAGEQEIPQPVELFVLESELPGDLLYHLAKDAANGGKELERITKLSPVAQVREMTKLESKLIAERAARTAGTPEASNRPAEAKPAAQRKPAPPVVPPIEPVGSRAAAKGPSLQNATTMKDYIRMRQNGVNR